MTKQSSASAASSPLTQVPRRASPSGFIIWAALEQSEDGRLDLRDVHVVHRRADHAARAAEVAVGHQRADPARARRGRERLRPARPRGRARPRHASCSSARAASSRFERVSLRYAGHRPRRARRRDARDRAGRDRRAGRPVGQRQDLARQPDPALLRALVGAAVRRRPRHHDAHAREPAPPDRAGVAGRAAVQRHGRGEHRLRRDGRRAARRRSSAPPRPRTRSTSSARCRRASTRRSASTA